MWSVLLCLCLSVSMSVSVWEGGCSWLREVAGRRGSNFLPFSGPSVGYIEFLFWDHWETAVLGQILAGRSREVTGAKFCHLVAPRPPIEFLFWDHWETAVVGKNCGREVTGGYGRLWEVTGGYGRLRSEKRRKVEERQEKGRRKPKKTTEMSSVKCRV